MFFSPFDISVSPSEISCSFAACLIQKKSKPLARLKSAEKQCTLKCESHWSTVALLYSRVNLTICYVCGWDWPPFVLDKSNCGDQKKFKQRKMQVPTLQAAHNFCTQTSKHPWGIYFYSKAMSILQPSEILFSERFSSGILLPQIQASASQFSPVYALYPAKDESHQWAERSNSSPNFQVWTIFLIPTLRQ